jgi:hypothetical protein
MISTMKQIILERYAVIHSFLYLFSLLFFFPFLSPCLSFIHQWPCSPLLGPGLFFGSVIFFIQSVGLLGRVISLSQGRYLHTEQTHTDIHASSGIRIHDPSVRVGEDSSSLKPRGHCNRPSCLSLLQIVIYFVRYPSFIFLVFNAFIDPKLLFSFSTLL